MILSRAFALWRTALRSHAVWSAALWNAVFSWLFILITELANPQISSRLFPQADSLSEVYIYHPHLLAVRNVLELITVLAVGPWVLSGVYGILGQVIADAQVSWQSFGRLARIFYGRLWGLFLFIWIWMLGLGVLGFMVLAILHGFGFLVVIILSILSLPGLVRMTGGLFVNRLSWTDSFADVFNRSGYTFLLIGALLGLLISTILGGIGLTLMTTLAGLIVYDLILVVLSITLPLWFFSLYRASTSVSPYAWIHDEIERG